MITLKEIADATGVSKRTVSRALNKNGYVRTELKEKIISISKKLGYLANPAAQSLRTGKSYEVGVLLFQNNELTMNKISAFEKKLRQAGYLLVVHFVDPGSDEISDIIKSLISRRVAGVAVCKYAFYSSVDKLTPLKANHIPIVFLDLAESSEEGVFINRSDGVHESIMYLASQGYQRIAYLGLPNDPSRIDGYMRALSELQRSPILLPFDAKEDARFGEAYKASIAFACMNPRPDAIQAFSDEVAFGFIAGIHKQGLLVPRDVAVVGFNDCAAASLCTPQLTTIAMPNSEVGIAAADIMLAKINDQSPLGKNWRITLPMHLVVRGSTMNKCDVKNLSKIKSSTTL